MEQILIKESATRRILFWIGGFIAVFVFTTIFLAGKGFDVFYWGLNIAVFLVCLIAILLEENTTIFCDKTTCTVVKKKFWEAAGKSQVFKWDEVSETAFYADDETRAFYVEANRRTINLLTNSSIADFDYVIETVNQSTPQLSYTWKKDDGMIGEMFESRRFIKVNREKQQND